MISSFDTDPPPSPPSFFLSSSISRCWRLMSALSDTTSLTVALVVMRFARIANRSVECVSSACVAAGVTLHTTAVLLLPPSESFRMYL